MAKILYIEDIQDNITLVEKIVTSRGHEFLYAKNAEQGLELAFSSTPDLIPDLENIPIIVLTAWPEEVVQHTVEAYNLNGYLCKPFNMRDLIDIIDKTLGAKAL